MYSIPRRATSGVIPYFSKNCFLRLLPRLRRLSIPPITQRTMKIKINMTTRSLIEMYQYVIGM